MPDDAVLVQRAQRGDSAAFGDLVRRYTPQALRLATAIGGTAVADDAVQEAFVRAFRSIQRFRTAEPFRPWLMAIVANCARSQLRARGRWLRNASMAANIYSHVRLSAESDVMARGDEDAVLTALGAIPRAQREVVACRYLMEFSEAETATFLGVPAGTVKSRLSRGLARLEAILQEPHHAQ